MAASNGDNAPKSTEQTRGKTAKDYTVRKDPDIRGANKARREESYRTGKVRE